jgi:hypothetical protein
VTVDFIGHRAVYTASLGTYLHPSMERAVPLSIIQSHHLFIHQIIVLTIATASHQPASLPLLF